MSDPHASRQTSERVSFVVPTLNRGRYVVRAVASCLIAQEAFPEVDVEVIVLDSESDDGSWELLESKFAADSRVHLARNQRGLGPTRSWLDGVRLISGQYVTFLWSDDYVAPAFLETLVPLLRGGSAVAIASGAVRDIDDETPLPTTPGQTMVTGEALALSYFGLGEASIWGQPVSPAASLFSRAVFDDWVRLIESWACENPLRSQLLWRRAIGPDLMLFLIASVTTANPVHLIRRPLAQFSHHGDSITVSSPAWPLRTGYWLAKVWLLHHAAQSGAFSDVAFERMTGRTLIHGLLNLARVPASGFGDQKALQQGIRNEISGLWRVVRRRANGMSILRRGFASAIRTVVSTSLRR